MNLLRASLFTCLCGAVTSLGAGTIVINGTSCIFTNVNVNGDGTMSADLSDCTVDNGGGPPPTGSVLSISPAAPSITESNANQNFTVSLSPANQSQTVTVNYYTQNGSATAGSDYTAVPNTQLSFTPGQTARTISVGILDDDIQENAETFSVRLASPSGATLGTPSQSTVTILANDSSTPPNDDPGVGTGLWMPPGATNHFVVDQSIINGAPGGITYAAGCVNSRDFATTNCEYDPAVTDYFAGQPVTVSADTNQIISIRYRPVGATSYFGSFTVGGQTGGALGRPVTITMSTTPGDLTNVPPFCKYESSGEKGTILIMPTMCAISASQPIYYLNIQPHAGCAASGCVIKVSNGARTVLY